MPTRRRGGSTAACAGRLRWLVLSSSTAIFHIGSRQGDEIRDLIGDAFLGWLVSDGYGAYRKFKKRQRCLAHLIRKGIALASTPRAPTSGRGCCARCAASSTRSLRALARASSIPFSPA